MNSPNPQHEPTMEEILASIRKIISEDQPEAVNAQPAPAARAPEPAPAAADTDVLDLTEEVAEPAPAKAAAPAPQPIENDIAFETIEEPKRESRAMEADDLISDKARNAMGRAFAHLDTPAEAAAPAGTLDSIFIRAVQDAFQPALHEWVDGHQAEIMEQMKPLIRAWMDEHLPPLIEAAVTKEISRAVPGRRR